MPTQHLQQLDLPPQWPSGVPEQSRLQQCIHEAHRKARLRILIALAESAYRSDQRSARRLATCGNSVRFYIDPDLGKVSHWMQRCRHRMCPFCARARSATIAAQMHTIVQPMPRPRLLVLTVKSTDQPLGTQLANLRNWFAKLRRRAFWKANVRGGVYTVEITCNEDTGLWHPHLHVIYDGDYLPQKALRFLWHKITGKSDVIWLEEVKDRHGAVKELCKYIGKPQRASAWSNRKIRAYAQAVNGTRMVQTFGATHGRAVEDRDTGRPDAPKEYSVSLQRLVFLARYGAGTPQRLVEAIAARWPCTSGYIYHELPQLAPEPTEADKATRRRAIIEGRAPPRRGPATSAEDREKQDARLFLIFTRYRQEQQAGDYLNIDWTGQSDQEQ